MQQASNLTKEQQYQKVLRYRWIVYGILVLCYFFVFLHRMAVGVIKTELIDEFAMTPVGFATLGSMYFYAYALMQIPTGILADTLCARITVTVGSVITALGSILFGLAPGVGLAYAGRLLVGLGVSVTFISVTKIQTMWFKEKEFGTMTGLTSLIGNAGGIVAQTPLALLVAAFTWRTTFVGFGIISLIIALLCIIFVRNKPQDMNLPSIAEIEGREEVSVTQEKVSVKEGLKGVLSNRRVIAPFLFLMLYSAVFLTFAGTWGVSYVRDVYGLQTIEASQYMLYMMLAQAAANISIGVVSDKIKSRKKPLIVLGALGSAAWIAITIGGKLPLPLFAVLLVVFSFSITCLAMAWSIGKEVCNPRYSGMAVSVVNTGGFVGAAVGPAVFGALLKEGSGISMYQSAMIFLAALCLAGYISSLFAKETHCRNIYYDDVKNRE